ncbi:MAG: hypothetical protein LUE64_05340, partial [Candidatus Gastranaerophilales bacterium]|nr:hypothetical protein [Candidatus Gastranaerophilales bacterium]
YYKADELEFLDKTLSKFQDKKAIIFQHFPVVPPAYDDMKKTYKAELYKNVLSRHNNVLAIVSGHYNKEALIEENGIKHISVSGLYQSGEYEQIKIFKNKNGSYSLTARVISVN